MSSILGKRGAEYGGFTQNKRPRFNYNTDDSDVNYLYQLTKTIASLEARVRDLEAQLKILTAKNVDSAPVAGWGSCPSYIN